MIFLKRHIELKKSGWESSCVLVRLKACYTQNLKDNGGTMKKIIATIVCVAVLAFIAVAQANQVRFLSRTSDGVAPSQDIHYTVMDLNGNKVAEDTVNAPEGEGVTIDNLPAGTYFISAEQESTGYFGSITTEVVSQEAQQGDNEGAAPVDLELGPDGLRVYNPEAAAQPVAPASNAATPNYLASTPTTTSTNTAGMIPGYYDGGYGGYGAGFGTGTARGGLGFLGWLGVAGGIAGLAVALATASKTAE